MIPIRPSNLIFSSKWPNYIIIHHTYELFLNNGSLIFDTNNFQYPELHKTYYSIYNNPELPYNFIIDKVKNDYELIVGRPLLTKIIYADIEEKYYDQIHIGLIGNYNEDLAENRLYATLAYRIIVPLMRLLNIPEDHILLHREIAYDPDENCPGEFFLKSKLNMHSRSQIKKKSVTRR